MDNTEYFRYVSVCTDNRVFSTFLTTFKGKGVGRAWGENPLHGRTLVSFVCTLISFFLLQL